MKTLEKAKRKARAKRRNRVRAKIFGTKEIPRLSVFRSNKGFFIQLIDDNEGKTLASVDSKEIKGAMKKTDAAKEGGRLVAKKAIEKKIGKVVFDRGGYKYHGRVKAVADGAREGGLKF